MQPLPPAGDRRDHRARRARPARRPTSGRRPATASCPALADTLSRLARGADHVARLGPAGSAVLLPETDEVAAINYVERVRAACELWLESGAIALRLAIGWASTAGDPTLADADRASPTERMYVELRRATSARRRDPSSRVTRRRARAVALARAGQSDAEADPAPRRRAGVRAVVDDERAVDDDVLDAGREASAARRTWRRADRRRIEHDEVGDGAVADDAAVAQPEPRRAAPRSSCGSPPRG